MVSRNFVYFYFLYERVTRFYDRNVIIFWQILKYFLHFKTNNNFSYTWDLYRIRNKNINKYFFKISVGSNVFLKLIVCTKTKYTNLTFILSIFREMASTSNPWLVDKLEQFLFFCCPECNEKYQSKETFVLHASNTHPRSKECLELKVQSYNVMVIGSVPQATSYELVQNLNQGVIVQNNVEYAVQDDYHNDSIDTYSNQYQSVKTISPKKPFQKVIISPGKIMKSNIHQRQKVKKDLGKIHQQKIISTGKISKPLAFKCGHCAKAYVRNADLKRHIITAHKQSKIVEDWEFRKNEEELDLFDNPFIDKRQSEQEFQNNHCCDLCNLSFSNSNSLSKHIISVHDPLKKEPEVFKCTKCPKVFEHINGLNLHNQSVHEGIRFKCQFCDKAYTTKYNVENHIRMNHSGIKDQPDMVYECDHCGKEFCRKDSYVRHVKTLH